MQKGHLWGHVLGALLVALVVGVGIFAQQASAETSTSPNYQMTESEFGNATGVESCSSQYCSQVTVGDDGQSSSASSAEFGTANYSEPLLEMIVTTDGSNLGDLSTERTGTKTMSVKVRNYLSGGYRLMIVGDAPKYGARSLATIATPTVSKPGTEQFGINVVANTTPSVGKNPVLQPGEGDGVDLITADYKVPNLFKYINGDTVALSQQNTGGADFTVTMIVNISNVTPAGHYTGDFAAVIVPYF